MKRLIGILPDVSSGRTELTFKGHRHVAKDLMQVRVEIQ